ncbi:MAG: PspC domain-containing protein, partial [Bacteroidales bacterium]
MKRFYRSSQNRVLGGVAAGLANYFEIDVLLIRLLFIVLAITGGLGFLIYFFLWICSPYAKTTKDSVLNNTGNKPTTMESETIEAKTMGSETIEAKTIESETMEAKTIETNENASSQPINSSPKKCKNKNASGFLWGSLFLFLGLILLGNSFDLFHFQFHHIWKLWPLVFCFIGINMLPLRKALRWLCNILLLVLSIVLLIGVGFCPSFCHNLDKDSTWEHSFFHNKETYIKGDSDNNIHFQIQAERKENHTAQLNLEIGAGSLMGFIPLNGSNLAYATCRDSSNGSVSSKIFETQAQD